MATILKGAAVTAALNQSLTERTSALKEKGILPTLAIVRVGERGDDISYEKGAIKRCEKIGVGVKQFLLPADVPEETLLATIEEINADPAIHGCLLFRPLPGHIDGERIRRALAPQKDVDGITDGSLAGVFSGSGEGYPPCTAQACMEILDHYGYPLQGKKAVVVGRSLVVGKPAAMLLLQKTPPSPSATPARRICLPSAGRQRFSSSPLAKPAWWGRNTSPPARWSSTWGSTSWRTAS